MYKYKEQTVDKIVEHLGTLFITYRKQYLIQLGKEQGYRYISTKRAKLTNDVVTSHVNSEKTVGVKLGNQGLTKFLTFDIDIINEEDRKETTLKLVQKLNEYYGISMQDIHVWFSGKKGYHVDLYFDDIIPEKMLIPFYNEVLLVLSETAKRIERRPTTGLGVKLPLGVHKETGEVCYYVDNQTLEKLPLSYFLDIEPQSLTDFKEYILDDISEPVSIQESELPLSSGDYDKKFDGSEVRESILSVLKTGHLLSAGSRNDFIYYGSMVLKGEGHELEDTFDIIFEILRNTYVEEKTRKYLDRNWSLESLAKETMRVVKNTYKRDYRISLKAREVTFYKEELDIIMTIKRKNLRRLMFSLLHHSKKYANGDGSFYCTHKKLAEMGNDSNSGRSMGNIRELEKLGFIRVLSSRVFVSDDRCQPNYYKVLIDVPHTDTPSQVTYDSTEYLELEQVVRELYSKEEIRRDEETGDKFIFTFHINDKEHPSN